MVGMDQPLFLFLDGEDMNHRLSQLRWACRGLSWSTPFLIASSTLRTEGERPNENTDGGGACFKSQRLVHNSRRTAQLKKPGEHSHRRPPQLLSGSTASVTLHLGKVPNIKCFREQSRIFTVLCHQ
ncbi:hypothetical protein LEMLEM_LOCUS21816 [Lemmus lemmus]